MSLDRLATAIEPLPYSLKEPIFGYARAVEQAAPSIARGAGIELSDSLSDALVFAAGVRKYYAFCHSAFWAIDNSARFLHSQEVDRVRVGRTDYSRGGELHRELGRALQDFDAVLRDHRLQVATDGSLADLLLQLASHGR